MAGNDHTGRRLARNSASDIEAMDQSMHQSKAVSSAVATVCHWERDVGVRQIGLRHDLKNPSTTVDAY